MRSPNDPRDAFTVRHPVSFPAVDTPGERSAQSAERERTERESAERERECGSNTVATSGCQNTAQYRAVAVEDRAPSPSLDGLGEQTTRVYRCASAIDTLRGEE